MLNWSKIENPLGAIIGIAFVIFLALLSWAYSQETSPTPTKESHEPQSQSAEPSQNSANDKRGTEHSPFIVKIIPTKNGGENTAAGENKELNKSSADDKIARFTELLFYATVALAVMAFIQAVVFGWQGIQLREAVSAARDEFLATHRPKIRIKHLWLANDIWSGEKIAVNLVVVNNGPAAATMNEIGIRFEIARANRDVPFDPDIAAIQGIQVQGRPLLGYPLPTGISLKITGIQRDMVLNDEQNVAIQNGTSRLYCIGFVSYFDGVHRLRITGFL
jgi:hypothetical protein